MKLKQPVLLMAIGALVFFTTGCQWVRWLRLLSFKKQLARLERYVRVDDRGGLTLRFLKPVVYADDLRLLIADETLCTTNKNQVSWLWTYEKQYAGPPAESGDFNMSFTMLFENQKFSELRFPERFLVLMPKPLVLGFLRSVGQAEIDMRHGTVKMKWAGPGGDEKVQLPTRSQITSLLGAPFTITESNRTRTFLYKYYQRVPKPSSPAERLAWATFAFDDGGQVFASEGVIGNIKWSLTRATNAPEPRVTFSLVDTSVEPVALKLPPELLDDFPGQYNGPAGRVVNIGRDGEAFVACWTKEGSGGWCAAAPELTNVLFGLPSGTPLYTFVRDNGGAVTGLVTQVEGSATPFTKSANPLPPGPVVAQVDPGVYAACAGRYKASWGGFVTISREQERLFWQNDGVQARIPLYPSSETNFFFKAVDSPLTFVKDSKGEVTKFILHFNGHNVEAVKE